MKHLFRYRHCISATLIIETALFLFCTLQTAGPGNSSDTGNVVKIAAKGTSISVTSEKKCDITVFSTDYVPMTQFRTGFIDSSSFTFDSTLGEYLISSLPEGRYNILIRDRDSGLTAFIGNIPAADDSSFIKKDTLRDPGVIEGTAKSRIDGSELTWTYAYIPGSPYYDYTGYLGKFTFYRVPEGKYLLNFYGIQTDTSVPTGSNPATNLTTEADTIIVLPGGTTTFTR